jgi:hypothetical protein
MDFLRFDSKFQVLICTRCHSTLVLDSFAARLSSARKEEVTKAERKDCLEQRKDQPLQLAKIIQQFYLLVDILPIPHLAFYHSSVGAIHPLSPHYVEYWVDSSLRY